MLKMDHPCFLHQGVFLPADDDFRPGDGHVCLFPFGGSGAALPGGRPFLRLTGNFRSNRPGLANRTGRRKSEDGNNGIRPKQVTRNPALKFVGVRVMVSMNFQPTDTEFCSKARNGNFGLFLFLEQYYPPLPVPEYKNCFKNIFRKMAGYAGYLKKYLRDIAAG